MADLARLGFATQTQDLTTAEHKLQKLVPAAKNAENAAKRLGTSFIGVGTGSNSAATGTQKFTGAINSAATGTEKFSRAALSAGTAMGTVASGVAAFNTQALNVVNNTAAATTKLSMLSMASSKLTSIIQGISNAASNAASRLFGMGDAGRVVANDLGQAAVSMRAAGQTAGQLQANTSNLVAQFQDIGVTAAMGMNPMLIGFQQGAQIALVMQDAVGKNGLAGGLAQLGKSFLSVLGPVTFLSVAFTALLAGLIQWVDWTKVAKTATNTLADVIETAGVAIVGFGAVMALAFAPQIISAIAAITVSIGKGLVGVIMTATKAMIAFALANPFAAFVIAIAAVLTAVYAFRDDFKRIFGFDIIASVKDAANFIIGGFVGAFNGIKAVWDKLPAVLGDIAIRAANATIKAVTEMVLKAAGVLNPLLELAGRALLDTVGGIPELDNPYAGAEAGANDVINANIEAAQSFDYVGAAINSVKGYASDASKFLRGLDLFGGDDKKKKKGSSSGKTDAEKYLDIIKDAATQINALIGERELIGKVGEELYAAQAALTMFQQAQQKGLTLNDAQKNQINELAAAIGKLTAENERLQFVEDMKRAGEDAIADWVGRREAIGMTTKELLTYNYVYEAINDARRKGIKLLDSDIAKIKELGQAYGAQEFGTRDLEFRGQLAKDHEDNMFALSRERGEIGLFGPALAAYRKETELLIAAKRELGIVTDETAAAARIAAQEWGAEEEAVRRMREEVEFTNETTKGFFMNLWDRLKNSGNAWKTFGNTVLDVLNKIAERLMGGWLDQLLGGGQGGGGGLLGSITKLIGIGASAASGGSSGFGDGSNMTGGILRLAKGGVVDGTTQFLTQNGQRGEMGEAGPEAIMPLKRGADGSLGVQMHNAVQAANSNQRIELVVRAEEGDMFRPTVEAISENKAVQVTQAGIEAYDEKVPDRFQQIANDERMR